MITVVNFDVGFFFFFASFILGGWGGDFSCCRFHCTIGMFVVVGECFQSEPR